MKNSKLLILLIILVTSACANPSKNEVTNNDEGLSEVTNGQASQDNEANNNAVKEEDSTARSDEKVEETIDYTLLPTSGPDCYPDGEHPIGQGIADQFEQITDYEEVMVWFCNGATFEDILNALATEELSEMEAEDLLLQISAGKTWNEIWLELGITE